VIFQNMHKETPGEVGIMLLWYKWQQL
jgi:hypothetical protein